VQRKLLVLNEINLLIAERLDILASYNKPTAWKLGLDWPTSCAETDCQCL